MLLTNEAGLTFNISYLFTMPWHTAALSAEVRPSVISFEGPGRGKNRKDLADISAAQGVSSYIIYLLKTSYVNPAYAVFRVIRSADGFATHETAHKSGFLPFRKAVITVFTVYRLVIGSKTR